MGELVRRHMVHAALSSKHSQKLCPSAFGKGNQANQTEPAVLMPRSGHALHDAKVL